MGGRLHKPIINLMLFKLFSHGMFVFDDDRSPACACAPSRITFLIFPLLRFILLEGLRLTLQAFEVLLCFQRSAFADLPAQTEGSHSERLCRQVRRRPSEKLQMLDGMSLLMGSVAPGSPAF